MPVMIKVATLKFCLIVLPLVLYLLGSSSSLVFANMSDVNGDGIRSMVIMVAMEAEAGPFIKHLGLDPVDDFFPDEAPFAAFQGDHNGCKITVVTNGKCATHGVDNVGTVPAALATFLTLQKLKGEVDILVNAGTCGGFKSKGAEIGDAFLTTASANHDRRIPIPPFIPYGIGKIEHISTEKLAAAIGAKRGIVTTGNSLDMHDLDAHHIGENDASVKDMEAAAISWACDLHKTPHFGLKVVTDIVDGDKPTQEEFLENLHSASVKLQETLPKVIEYACGKGHEEL